MLRSRYQHHHGFRGFAERAAPQLIRWESPHGWTRYGFGSVAEKKDTLATVMSGLLVLPDHWVSVTECCLAALDAAASADEVATMRHWRSRAAIRADRADSLAAWHLLLTEGCRTARPSPRWTGWPAIPPWRGRSRTCLAAVLGRPVETCYEEQPYS
ncbi:hypothetical protein [Georgenia sp. Marseille-Q6866]